MADYATSEELQIELENLAEELGISVSEALAIVTGRIDDNVTAIEALNTATASNASAIEAITEMSDNGVQSIAEKLKALNDMFTEDDTLATDVLNRIATNATAIGANATEIEALKTAQTNLTSRVATVEQAIIDNATANLEARDALDAKITANKTASEARDATLTQSVEDEIARAKAVETANIQRIADLEDAQTAQGDVSESAINALGARISTVETDLNDTTDADDNLVKGVKTRVSDLEASVANLDGSGLAKGVICGRKAANKFRLQLGQAEKTFDCGSNNGDGEAI